MIKITLVLDNLRSCHNVGSIMRSADGLGVTDFIFIGTTPYPELASDKRLPHIKRKQTLQIHKTALGAELSGTRTYYDSVNDFLNNIGDKPLYALEQSSNSTLLGDVVLEDDVYLVLGAEVTGVSELLLCRSKHIEIPMQGKKESFNVAVAAGIAIYALLNH